MAPDALKSSFLFPVRNICSTKRVKVSVESARRAIQDPSTIITINPLVESFSQHPTELSRWTIVDRFRWLGMSKQLTYTVKFTLMEDGVDAEVKSAFGTRMKTQWRARGSSGGTEVMENVYAQSFIIFMPFIQRVIEKSHQEVLAQLAKSLEKSAEVR